MGLMKCKECGAEVSSKAAKCPKCGAPMPKKTSVFTMFVAGIFAIGAIGAVFGVSNKTPPTADDLAAQQAQTARVKAAQQAAAQIKQGARDPDSFKVRSARVSADAKTVCVEYQAKNGFGGMNQGMAVVAGGLITASASVPLWNKHCAEVKLFDLTNYVL